MEETPPRSYFHRSDPGRIRCLAPTTLSAHPHASSEPTSRHGASPRRLAPESYYSRRTGRIGGRRDQGLARDALQSRARGTGEADGEGITLLCDPHGLTRTSGSIPGQAADFHRLSSPLSPDKAVLTMCRTLRPLEESNRSLSRGSSQTSTRIRDS